MTKLTHTDLQVKQILAELIEWMTDESYICSIYKEFGPIEEIPLETMKSECYKAIEDTIKYEKEQATGRLLLEPLGLTGPVGFDELNIVFQDWKDNVLKVKTTNVLPQNRKMNVSDGKASGVIFFSASKFEILE